MANSYEFNCKKLPPGVNLQAEGSANGSFFFGTEYTVPKCIIGAVLFVIACCFALSEQKRDAPESREADQRIDHAADQRGLSAADPCHEIEFRKADQAPVDRADDREDPCDDIHVHQLLRG